jgi:hypothetical protein
MNYADEGNRLLYVGHKAIFVLKIPVNFRWRTEIVPR